MIDVAAYIGPYPFRHLPHPDPDVLVRVLEREGLGGAWVGYLPSAWHRDPAPGNDGAVRGARAASRDAAIRRRSCGPTGRAGSARCATSSSAARAAMRAYPMHWGMGRDDPTMRALALACGERGIPLVLTVRFEDLRQRHPLDVAGDLTAAHMRALARAGDGVRLVVTGAGRELLEETHWGLTPDEQRRVLLGLRLDLGTAGGSFRASAPHGRRGALRLRHALAAAAHAESARESRPAAGRAARTPASPMRAIARSSGRENADLTFEILACACAQFAPSALRLAACSDARSHIVRAELVLRVNPVHPSAAFAPTLTLNTPSR